MMNVLIAGARQKFSDINNIIKAVNIFKEQNMASESKKRKYHHSNLSNGGEKWNIGRGKRIHMFNKKERMANKKSCLSGY